MSHRLALLVAVSASLLAVSCTQAAPSPTAAPAPPKPAATAAPAAPAATAAPAAPTAAPAPAQPTAVPAKTTDFPAKGKTMSLIIPWAPGGAVDVSGRLMAGALEKEFGIPVQPVNREGASTQVGTQELVTAKPDGYTIATFSMPTTLITYLDPERKASYSAKDIQPIALYSVDPNVLAVKADSPYKTLKDLVDAAKAKPEGVKVATTGLMAAGHLAMASFGKMIGATFAFVHFNGGGPAVTALLGGNTDAITTTLGSVTSQYKSGTVRILGLMDSAGSDLAPGVPTFESQGYKMYVPVITGLIAPAGTPKEVVAAISAVEKKVLATDEVKTRFSNAGISVRYMDTPDFATQITQTESWTKDAIAIAKQ